LRTATQETAAGIIVVFNYFEQKKIFLFLISNEIEKKTVANIQPRSVEIRTRHFADVGAFKIAGLQLF
jgi:hypothetical protein